MTPQEQQELQAINEELARRGLLNNEQTAVSPSNSSSRLTLQEEQELKAIDEELTRRGIPPSQVQQAASDRPETAEPPRLDEALAMPHASYDDDDFLDKVHDRQLGQGMANVAKNTVATGVGSLGDLGVLGYNLGAGAYSFATGNNAHSLPLVSDKIAAAIDAYSGGFTKDKGHYDKYLPGFITGIFGLGAYGKALKAAKETPIVGSALEKIGNVASKFGSTQATKANVIAPLAAGVAEGYSKTEELDPLIEIPLVLGTYILGGKAGKRIDDLLLADRGILADLAKKYPGLKTAATRSNYRELADKIDPKSFNETLRDHIIQKETKFIPKQVMENLPEPIQHKINTNPAILEKEELDLVVQHSTKEFEKELTRIEKEYGLNFTLGEFTGSPKIKNLEDALANKPKVVAFDKNRKQRHDQIIRQLEKTKTTLSPKGGGILSLGNVIAKSVDEMYATLRNNRSRNWNQLFKTIPDAPQISISNYTAKLKEFSKLKGDTEANVTAISKSKERLTALKEPTKGYEKDASGIPILSKPIEIMETLEAVSPQRFNDILVGLTEDVSRLTERTFSRKQIGELKGAAYKDLENTISACGEGSEAASLIKQGRDQYHVDSKLIKELDNSVIFHKIDKDSLTVPEKVVKTLERMQPSELKTVVEAINRTKDGQQILGDIQAYYIERSIQTATQNGLTSFNELAFLKSLPQKESFNILFQDPLAKKQISDLATFVGRIVQHGSKRGGSPTAQRLEVFKELQGGHESEKSLIEAGKSAIKGDYWSGAKSAVNWIKGLGGGGLKDKNMAKALIDPEVREQILRDISAQHP